MDINPFYDAIVFCNTHGPKGHYYLEFSYDQVLKRFIPIFIFKNTLKTKRFMMRFTKHDNVKSKDIAEAFIVTLRENHIKDTVRGTN